MIRKDKFHITLLLCAILLCLAANGSVIAGDDMQLHHDLAGNASQAEDNSGYETDYTDREQEDEPAAQESSQPDNTVPLYINGALHSDCLVVDGTARMSLGRFATLAGLSFDGHAIGGVVPELGENGDYAVVNGRYFYLPDGLYEMGGELLWPLTALAKMFDCTATWDAASGSIDLDLTDVALLSDGETYYNQQDVYWLSRIIYAESGNQPLAGQIAVGNVVLNRVADERFPDSVYGVIFDQSYGVQFSPVETGGIYAEPDEEAVVAAKLALEGYNTAGESLYFVNPSIGAGSWFAANLTYVTSIGDHDFYA